MYNRTITSESPPALQNKLVMMVGLPRSGKSTQARMLGAPIVCPDAIRLALHGQQFLALAEPFVWAIAKVMVRALFLSGHDHVILDATNTTRKRRDEWKSSFWIREFRYIDTSADVCVERAASDHRPDLIEVIARMAAELEPPSADET